MKEKQEEDNMQSTKFHGLVLFLACASLFLTSVPAFGAGVTFNIDENCAGLPSTGPPPNCKLFGEPLSGLTTILYDLPGRIANNMVAGDFRIIEAGTTGIANFSDILRFDSQRGLYVFSDIGETVLADVGLPFSSPIAPTFQDFERELTPGVFGYIYTPNPGMPGFMDGGVTYNFISEPAGAGGEVPEPATILVMALPLAGILLRRRSSRV